METPCPHCGTPFEPRPFTLALPGGKGIELVTKLCPSCEHDALARDAADFRASYDRAKPLASLVPTPGEPVTVPCRVCGTDFIAETTVFKGDARVREKTIFQTVCDACAAKENECVVVTRDAETPEQKRRFRWVQMTGIRYSQFRREELPKVIQKHADMVLNWKPETKGIGLVGPPRTGKSPLLYALGQSLYVSGVDVFPTSGIEFQREYHRAFGDERQEWRGYLRECERSEVLIIDDADKLNLTAGVESEYYGMLERRRNWQLPVLCTLNLTGDEFAALGRDRSDRAAAIVERLRDLCEFIPV